MSTEVKNFYSNLKFPGAYTMDNIRFYDEFVCNDYLKFYDDSVLGKHTVLDVGCGTGLIVNILAHRHKNIQFTAIDFGDGIDFAKDFSKRNNINNITYHKVDFLDWNVTKKYDLVVCNGVLHHIPEQNAAITKLKAVANKEIILGVYNTYGKLAKRFFPVNYTNEVLYVDQEKCPFEVTYSDSEIQKIFYDYDVDKIFPSIRGKLVDLVNVFNYRNGGLTLYHFDKK